MDFERVMNASASPSFVYLTWDGEFSEVFMNNFKQMSSVRILVTSAAVMALYVTVMYFTQGFAFGQYQIRIATALYALAAPFPFLIVPLGLANLLSNLVLGSLGPLDAIGGFAAGLLTSAAVYAIRRFRLNDVLLAIPVTFIPGLLVPVWLSYLLDLPYSVLAVSLCVGQIIPGITGVLLVKALERVGVMKRPAA